ncbi:MAG: hypothetical protein ACP5VS_18555 [Desulfomonilaceae bacterium]
MEKILGKAYAAGVPVRIEFQKISREDALARSVAFRKKIYQTL